MADVKISQLPSASTPLAGTEEIPLVQSSTTKKITVSNLLTSANLGTPTAVNLTNATNVPVDEAIGVLPVANGGNGTATPSLVAGSNVTISGSWPNQTIAATGGGGGSGTVTDMSIVSANGLAGTVANSTTTPAVTLSTSVTGIVKGNGTALSAATAGTDYVAPGGALGTPSSGTATNLTGLPLSTGVTGTLPVANGGTGTTTPSLVAGTNVTISGTWPNQTINSSGGGGSMVYPGAGIPNSTGSAWDTSYTTTGSGTVVALATSPTLVTPILGTPQSGNFSSGTFTWPTFNQNTTGTAAGLSSTLVVGSGGTGATTLTGYVKGSGTSALTASSTIPSSDITGLGTMSTQDASSVAITGGTINGATIGATTAAAVTGTVVTATTKVVSPYFDAVNSAGGALRNASGTNQIQWGGGGGNNVSVDVSANLNGVNAQIDISPTGTGHVHIKPTGSGSIEIAPTSAGTMNNMAIGGTTPAAGAFTTVTASTAIGVASGGTGSTSLTANNVILGNGTSAVQVVAPGTSGNVLTSNGTTWQSTAPAASGVSQAKATAIAMVFGF